MVLILGMLPRARAFAAGQGAAAPQTGIRAQ
jgi:hypothetical protein